MTRKLWEKQNLYQRKDYRGPKSRGNLRTGGTDHREHKLSHRNWKGNDGKGKRGKKNDRNIRMKMDVDQRND